MPRYAIEACRARVTLSAANPAAALAWGVRNLRVPAAKIRVHPLTDNPPHEGHNTPNSMTTKTKKTEMKPVDIGTKVARVARAIKAKKKAAKAAKKPSLGERIEKVASKPTPKANPAPAAEKAMSGLDAAALVLQEAGKAMNAKEIVAAIQGRGLAAGLKGKTPHATIYAAMITEIAKKGEASRFAKADRGQFIASSK